jgi:hypothetical protein
MIMIIRPFSPVPVQATARRMYDMRIRAFARPEKQPLLGV